MFAGSCFVRCVGVVLLGWVSLAWSADRPPSWMSEPPADDAQSWYATGEGTDLESARRGALRNVAAKLRSTIEGQVTNRTTVENNKVDIRALSSVTEQVVKTEFTRFEVVKSAKGGIGVYVLVKVDRPAFIADTRSQLQLVDKPIRQAEAELPRQSTLDQYLALRRLNSQIETGTRLSLLLQGAGIEEEGRAGVQRYGGLMQTSKELGTKLTFYLRAPAVDADIASAIAAYLSEQGMRSSTTPTRGANVLNIESQGRQDDLFGSKMLKLKVRLNVLDDQGRAAGSREYEAPGASRYDFRGAREDAVKKLIEMMRQAGPLAALGFKE